MTTTQTIPSGITRNKGMRASLYTEIMSRVKKQDLLKKHPGFYITRFVLISVLCLACWAGLYAVSAAGITAWVSLPIAILLGVLTAQYGFIGHEAAHRQVFRTKKANDIAGLIIANLFAGLSYGFWIRKHNRHHVVPNQIGKDPDINIRVLAFTPEAVEAKKNPERWVTRHQGLLFPVLLMFTGFDLLLDSFISVGRKDDKKIAHRFIEFGLMMIRQSAPVILLLLMYSPLVALGLWLAFMLTFGLFMGAAFAPNHKGMPLVPKDSKIGFFERQVLTSRNIKPSWLKDNLMGGLNYQIEHHLFPSMPRPALKEARKLVKEYCEEVNVKYTETGLFESYGIVIRYLNNVGLSKNTDPFVCPMVVEFRPRM